MAEPFLILHKVRGKPAFDIAERVECSICLPIRQGMVDGNTSGISCDLCDNDGFFWIIPTSGHRAYPFWHYKLLDLYSHPHQLSPLELYGSEECPPDWPDHYAVNDRPTKSHDPEAGIALLAKLGLSTKAPQQKIDRRF